MPGTFGQGHVQQQLCDPGAVGDAERVFERRIAPLRLQVFIDHQHGVGHRIEHPAQRFDALLGVVLHAQFLADVANAAPHPQQLPVDDGCPHIVFDVGRRAIVATVHREGAVDAEPGLDQAPHECFVGRAARPVQADGLLIEIDIRRHLVDIGHGAVAQAPVGVVFKDLADNFVRGIVDVHRFGEFDAPVRHLCALQHLAHHFVGVVHFPQPVAQRSEGDFHQVQARRLHGPPFQQATGDHVQQAAIVANQGELQARDEFVGRRVGEQRLQGTHRLDAENAFDRLRQQFLQRIAQLIAQAGGQVEQLPVGADGACEGLGFLGQQIQDIH